MLCSLPARLTVGVCALLVALALPGVAAAGDRAADQEIADESVLTIDDVPSEFEESKAEDTPQVQPGPECKGLRGAAKRADTAPHKQVEFRSAGGGRALITNQVSVFPTIKQAKAVYAMYAGPNARRCLTTAYQRVFLGQIDDPSADVKVTADRFTPDLGDTAVGYDVVIEASAQGSSETFYVNVQVIRDGRGVDAFGFFNAGSPPPSDDVDDMTRVGAEKLEAALA